MARKFLYGLVPLLLIVMSLGGAKVLANSENGENVSEQHRAKVSEVVKNLEKVANKDGAIEKEVKSVAKEEKDAVEGVSEKMGMVEKRGGFKTFLIGSDYKNLGALRSELVTAQNRIDRLTKSLEKATSSTTESELKSQITELEAIKTKAESFIKSQEGRFSLFGWLVKMFQ